VVFVLPLQLITNGRMLYKIKSEIYGRHIKYVKVEVFDWPIFQPYCLKGMEQQANPKILT
jgi:hypothetical protein